MPKYTQTTTVNGAGIGNNLTHIDGGASVLEASKLMRRSGSHELLVVDKSHGRQFAFGILTANDIVTRVIATGLDPAVLTTGDIAWPEPHSHSTFFPFMEKKLTGNWLQKPAF